MTDSKGRQVSPPITDSVSLSIAKVSSALSVKAFLCVYAKILLTETELMSALNLTTATVIYQKAIYTLCTLKLISKYTDENRRTIYTVHSDIITDNIKCDGCVHSSKASFEHNFKSITHYECSAKVDCSYNYFRVAQGAIKRYKLLYGLEAASARPRVTKRGLSGRMQIDLPSDFQLWGRSHFVEYIYRQYEIHYPHVLDRPTKNEIGKACTHIISTFKAEFDDWQYRTRAYITHFFLETIKAKEFASLHELKKVKNMTHFADNNKKVYVELCDKYDIYCPYWKNSQCRIEQSQSTCTSKIRKSVLKEYN